MQKVYYVYIVFRLSGVPCYVGKGKDDRSEVHFQSSTLERPPNRHLASIIKKAGGRLPVVRVRNELTEQEAHEIEKTLIKALGRRPSGLLTNMTDGGEGFSNPSLETRAKMSIKRRARVTKEETRIKISVANKGKKKPPGFGEKISAFHRGRKRSEETRERIRISKKGVPRGPHSEATKQRMRKAWERRRLNSCSQ